MLNRQVMVSVGGLRDEWRCATDHLSPATAEQHMGRQIPQYSEEIFLLKKHVKLLTNEYRKWQYFIQTTGGQVTHLGVQAVLGVQLGRQDRVHHQYHCILAVHPLPPARQAQEVQVCQLCLGTQAYPWHLGCPSLLSLHAHQSHLAPHEDLSRELGWVRAEKDEERDEE